ncbi:YggT family protein, partial [bacterium]|nr:YggT family protein [bacterium]
IISWVARDSRNEVILWILKLTEPILRPLRTLVPVPGLDLSPLLAWLLIRFLMNLIARG